MLRLIVTAVAAGVLVAASFSSTYARPSEPDGCTVPERMRAFAKALGEGLVGSCVRVPIVTNDGDVQQLTSRGALYWSERAQLAGFVNETLVIWDGPFGIGSPVTISGLGDSGNPLAPVVAPAAQVLELAVLQPRDVRDRWQAVGVPDLRGFGPVEDPVDDEREGLYSTACTRQTPQRQAGTIQTWLYNAQTRQDLTHMVTAIRDGDVSAWRSDVNTLVERCSAWTVSASRGDVEVRLAIEPFTPLGDDAFILDLAMTHLESGQMRHFAVAVVRYGGLVSMLGVTSAVDQPLDEVRDELATLAQQAQSRIRTVAWYLQPRAVTRPSSSHR